MLSLTAADMEWGEMALRRLGIPKGAWFVCVHVRESGFSPIDEELHLHRNGSIENVIPALKEITNRGGWVIRIGDPTMTPLPPIPQTIDYAHHAMKSERLDVILCARSRFILGCTSGISIVGSVFGIPCAIANMIPVLDLWFNSKDISIPKLLWLEKNGRYIRLDEATASHVSKYRYASLYRDAGIRVEENSAEDILDLTIEMFDRLEGKFMILDSDEELLSCFLSLIEKDHYAFGSCAVISTVFLRKHASLLPHPPLSN
jgi:putative glycosyltransferase (TIGR04372 family)